MVALDDVSFRSRQSTASRRCRPNGAGKTTLFNIVAGAYASHGGAQSGLAGRMLNGMPAHDRVRLGIARTFQKALLFDNMTVLENVMVGWHPRSPHRHAGCGPAPARRCAARKSASTSRRCAT